jgi:uncharacterized protein (TIGR02594 family)
MRLTVILAALFCVVCSPSFACDAMRPCYPNGRPLFASNLSQDSFSHHRATRHRARHETHRRVPHGLARVMAEGAGRAVSWHRPRAWCGWWMRRHLGVANPAGNLARWWAHYGTAAHGPAVGTIVVWARGRRSGHVGIITGRTADGRWIVKSGNDGHRVRERPRSVAGAIAFRWPGA